MQTAALSSQPPGEPGPARRGQALGGTRLHLGISKTTNTPRWTSKKAPRCPNGQNPNDLPCITPLSRLWGRSPVHSATFSPPKQRPLVNYAQLVHPRPRPLLNYATFAPPRPRPPLAALPTCRPADLPTDQPADLPTYRPATLPTCRHADLPTCQLTYSGDGGGPADLPACRLADLPTYRLAHRFPFRRLPPPIPRF